MRLDRNLKKYPKSHKGISEHMVLFGFKHDDVNITTLISAITDSDSDNNKRYKFMIYAIENGHLPIFDIIYNYCISGYDDNADLSSELMRFRYAITNYIARRKDDMEKVLVNDSGDVALLSDLLRRALLYEYGDIRSIYDEFISVLWETVDRYDSNKGGFISYILSFWKFKLIDMVIYPALKFYFRSIDGRCGQNIYSYTYTQDEQCQYLPSNVEMLATESYKGTYLKNKLDKWFLIKHRGIME